MNRADNKQKNILFTSSNFPTGGPGAVFLNLFCKGMTMNQHSIRVYMTRGYAYGDNKKKIYRHNITSDGVHYSTLGLTKRPKNSIFKLADGLISFFHLMVILPEFLLKREKPSIFIYQTDFTHSLLLYFITPLFRVKTITFVPEYFYKEQFKGFVGKLNWLNFNFTFNHLNVRSKALIVFSHFLKEVYIKKGFNAENIFVLPNLTDFEFWKVPETEEKFTVGYSGTPSKKDGLIDLFVAISLLRNEFPVNLLVVGDSTFGNSLIPKLEEECIKLGIRDQVYFTGLIEYDQVKTWLSQCKILAITRPRTLQTQAGFPTKLGEYMALMKPVLATDFGEIEKYFESGQDVIMAESDNPLSISTQLKWMILNDEKSKEIGANGYKKAYDLFSYDSAVQRISELLDLI